MALTPNGKLDQFSVQRHIRDTYMHSTDKLVAFVLLSFRSATTAQCNPSLTRICAGAGLGRTAVVDALNRLDTSGFVHRRRGTSWRTTEYTFSFDEHDLDELKHLECSTY